MPIYLHSTGAMRARQVGHSRVEALFVAEGAESRQKQDIKAGRNKEGLVFLAVSVQKCFGIWIMPQAEILFWMNYREMVEAAWENERMISKKRRKTNCSVIIGEIFPKFERHISMLSGGWTFKWTYTFSSKSFPKFSRWIFIIRVLKSVLRKMILR